MSDTLNWSIDAANASATRHPSIQSTMRAVASEVDGIRQTFQTVVAMGDAFRLTMAVTSGQASANLDG